MNGRLNGRRVTVFGGSGFLGRYVVRALLAEGARVIVATPDPRDGWFLKTQGPLGQTAFAAADIRVPATVERAVAGSDMVINLVGVLSGNMAAIHVDGARNVARAASVAGAKALVHISAIGADPASPSAYGRTKGEGEAAVRAAFPDAVIVRPSLIAGAEDNFINRFAAMIKLLPVVPVVCGDFLMQPVFVGDVAAAIVESLAQGVRGRTLEIGGPERLSMAGLFDWIGRATGYRRIQLPLPDAVSGAMARLTGWLPGAPITMDQFRMLQSDNVVTGEDGLRTLGLTATPIESVAPEWLVRFRRAGRFNSRFA